MTSLFISAVFLIESSYRYGTIVRPSTRLWSDFTRVTSTNNPYTSICFVSMLSYCLTSILLADLVCILAFPMRLAVIHLYAQAKSVTICNTVASYINVILKPFNTMLSSAKFMCCVSFSLCNQLTFSTVASLCSSEIPVTRELASTHMSSLGPSMHHLPHTGFSWCTLAKISFIIVVRGVSFNLSSQLVITAAALLLMNASATLSHPLTVKCSTGFLHSETILCQV